MIEHLHIKNFKCLLDVEIALGPFTILIGPNDSGKTSLLDAIQLLGRTTKEPWDKVFSGGTALSNCVWRKDLTRCIGWRVSGTTSEGLFAYTLELSPIHPYPQTEALNVNGQAVFRKEFMHEQVVWRMLLQGQELNETATAGGTGLRAVVAATRRSSPKGLIPLPGLFSTVEAISSTTKYCLDPDAMRAEVPLESDPVLSSSGANLAAVLDAILSGPDRQAVLGLEQALHEAIQSIRGVAVPVAPSNKNAKSLHFVLNGKERPAVTIPATLASDGAMLLTAFLALAYGNTPSILLIEEPENGLHPSRLKLVVELLRKISKGEVGNRPRQVLLTTHSPILLNFAQPEEVRILTRDPERGTQVKPMTEVSNIKTLLEEFAPGELWYLLGEEALLKEQPA
ncbi:MAG TPA: AAA family ATPase [Gemmataceae bacterium]|nr:AAA family ATPase [Gemmataceae bacterium]